MSRFTARLIVSPEMDGKSWMVLCSEQPHRLNEKNLLFGYDIGEEGSQSFVDIRRGFITDFASVPRFLWWLLPQWGVYGKAAVIHDYLYVNGTYDMDAGLLGVNDVPCSRKEADDIFLEAMEVLNTPRWQKYLIYAGVRIGGWLPWRRYRK